jgi:hypothetical protein
MAGGKRKNADAALALALASGATVAAAAAKAGVSESTAHRRLRLPEFRARVDAARADLLARAVGLLTALGEGAVGKLIALIAGATTAEAIRLGAIRTALEYLFKGNEQLNLARQVEELRHELEALRHAANAQARGGPAAGASAGGPADGQPPLASAAGRPESHPDRGGDDAGPLAGGPAALPFE